MHALSARLSLLADEVIFQKRLYQLNTILLLITIGVVIFSRNDRLVVPLSQHLRTRSSARIFESPPNSPPPRLVMLRRDSSDSLAPNSPVEYVIPGGSSTVTMNSETGLVGGGHLPLKYSSRETSPVMESKSSPPTPHGVRGVSGKSWIPFGPQLRVEGQGRRWQRLPSPLGSSTDVRPAGVDEDEEVLVDGDGGVDVINGEPGGEIYHDQNGET